MGTDSLRPHAAARPLLRSQDLGLYREVVYEPPAELTDADVVSALRTAWDPEISGVEHLALGFGAHHWRADAAATPRLFVTYDRLGRRHTAESLERAYNGAIALAEARLEFVVAPVRTLPGRALLPLAAGALSCTPWVPGAVVGDGPITDETTAAANLADLARLHQTPPPPGLRRWTPLVEADFVDRLRARADCRWDTGPYGERARRAVSVSLCAMQEWTRRYLARAEAARTHPWVATHGEPHTRNQIRTAGGIRFVDWESLRLAPRERDLSSLVRAGYGRDAGADPSMVEVFDLEWRLSEIAEYAEWFSTPHTGTADDATALHGLLEELDREPWWRAV